MIRLKTLFVEQSSVPADGNAGAIQKFLKSNGFEEIDVDWSFGPETARAVWHYVYDSDPGDITVAKLWQKMKNEKDLPETDTMPGYGPIMAKAVAKKINSKQSAPADDSKKLSDDALTDFNKLIEIGTSLYSVLDKEPEKYFKRFKGVLNDKETEAANWFIRAWNKAWSTELKRISNSENKINAESAKMIQYRVNWFKDAIESGQTASAVLKINYPYGKLDSRSVTIKINWNYM